MIIGAINKGGTVFLLSTKTNKMKLIQLSKPARVFLPFLAILMLLTFGSCSRRENFQLSTVTPAARGFVRIKKDRNNDYNIKIKISDLAEVVRLQPPASTYVIWLVASDSSVKNIGQIKSSKRTFSKNLKGYFETVSSVNPKRIFITAETDGTVQYPNTEIVLTTNNF